MIVGIVFIKKGCWYSFPKENSNIRFISLFLSWVKIPQKYVTRYMLVVQKYILGKSVFWTIRLKIQRWFFFLISSLLPPPTVPPSTQLTYPNCKFSQLTYIYCAENSVCFPSLKCDFTVLPTNMGTAQKLQNSKAWK